MNTTEDIERATVQAYVDLFCSYRGLLDRHIIAADISLLELKPMYEDVVRGYGVEKIYRFYSLGVNRKNLQHLQPSDLYSEINDCLEENQLPQLLPDGPHKLLNDFFNQDDLVFLSQVDIAALKNCYLDDVDQEVFAKELGLGDGGSPLYYALEKIPGVRELTR